MQSSEILSIKLAVLTEVTTYIEVISNVIQHLDICDFPTCCPAHLLPSEQEVAELLSACCKLRFLRLVGLPFLLAFSHFYYSGLLLWVRHRLSQVHFTPKGVANDELFRQPRYSFFFQVL